MRGSWDVVSHEQLLCLFHAEVLLVPRALDGHQVHRQEQTSPRLEHAEHFTNGTIPTLGEVFKYRNTKYPVKPIVRPGEGTDIIADKIHPASGIVKRSLPSIPALDDGFRIVVQDSDAPGTLGYGVLEDCP